MWVIKCTQCRKAFAQHDYYWRHKCYVRDLLLDYFEYKNEQVALDEALRWWLEQRGIYDRVP